MRDYARETERRVAFIRGVLRAAGANGIVYGNSGGKDSALVGILCKLACGDTLGLVMPCGSKRNYGEDKADAEAVAAQFGIETRVVDLSAAREALIGAVGPHTQLNDAALANLAPRLRMAALYAVAGSENRLVAGTGNRSEIYMGYFTKWGDGACDFNPIADLTVTEVYEYLRYLGAPGRIVGKAPSAGLYDGQTDEAELGVAYRSIDALLLTGAVNEVDRAIIDRFHNTSAHKRKMPAVYGDANA
ncbi:MAG: NAD(+) synthase [Oscillospiraceae bacterium]|nr:NAD(+) synthase [Oscillospiraceae bacterium]